MTPPAEQVTVDAQQYIDQLRAQLVEAWGEVQAQLALARTESTVRAAREAEKDRQLTVSREAAADKDREIAELKATIASLQGSSTRP
ncbi:hypothetical protein HUT16_27360 [Kitasatospora sp. NA04385]|uniref:hypothetical protein n=1 Tax=Kitasatospora sp. NA04385 TaxID=2742135 RepID=UPI001590083D|nr:hypothetical protein [Kitasatospora sp. NA04385]QKW22299.1 hypothetical protein HUT16_27360 [Kitasatospora sp. NA04385]